MWAGMLVVEILAFRAWLVTFTPPPSNSLAVLLMERGPGTPRFAFVQFAVSFAVVSLILGRSTVGLLQPRLAELAQRGVRWKVFLGHVGLAALFAGLTTVVLDRQLSAESSFGLTALWLLVGASALGTSAVAFMPVAFWTLLARSTREVVAFGALVGIGAFAFGRVTVNAWPPLSHATMDVVYVLLQPVVPLLSANVATLTIGNPDFQVQIAAQCSGTQGLGLMLAFLAAWLWFHRAEWRFPHALVMLPVGLGAIWTLNCLRVAGLILIGIAGAPDVAVGGFHSQAGWVAFNAVALGVCLTARRVPWLLKQHTTISASIEASGLNPTGAYLLPFLAVLAGSMMAQLASSNFEWFYVVRVALSGIVLWYFASTYRTLNWRIDSRAIGLGCAAFVIWVGMEALVGSVSKSDMPAALSQAPATWSMAWILVRIFGSVLTVPIAEELAFRGYLMRWLDSEDFHSVAAGSVSWMAILFSSLAFGILHGERWFAATMAGVIYAIAYRRRGSIGDAVAAHVTTNALIAIAVLAANRWQFW
jgi:exosortase E/protease (VPEID-CTERM system)